MHRPHSASRVHVHTPSVVVHNLHIARPVVGPAEADAPLCVDPNAVLTAAVAPQYLKPIARQGGEIPQRLCVVQNGETARRNSTTSHRGNG